MPCNFHNRQVQKSAFSKKKERFIATASRMRLHPTKRMDNELIRVQLSEKNYRFMTRLFAFVLLSWGMAGLCAAEPLMPILEKVRGNVTEVGGVGRRSR